MSERIALKARYVFPVTSPPVPDGVVTIQDGRIVTVVGADSDAVVTDLGNAAVVPGLVNAHAHLEFSDLDRPLGEPGIALPDWIRQVLHHRRLTRRDERRRNHADDETERGEAAEADADSAVLTGLAESQRCGTTMLGEIATPDWLPEQFDGTAIDCTVFAELIGLSANRAESLLDLAAEHVTLGQSAGETWQPGISPHAPYTVRTDLVERAAELSSQRGVPVAMHLAESPEELELLASHSGPLLELLTELEVWDPTAIPRGIRPLDYLRMLSRARRALVIHGNFLDADEIELLAEHAGRISLVYCPRTHEYFHGDGYPLAERLAAGVHVALGTDSRASNPDLSVLAEMRFVARRHGDVAPETVLRMATLGGATALGRETVAGSLEPGKRADLTVIRLPDRDADDPHELLLDSDEPALPAACGFAGIAVAPFQERGLPSKSSHR